MPYRNVGKTPCFPVWGESLTATIAVPGDGGDTVASRVPAATTRKTPTLRCALSSFPLTALVAALIASPSLAQEPTPTPIPPVAVPSPATPAPATPVAPQASAEIEVPRGRIRVFVRDAISKAFLNDAAVFFDDPTLQDLRSIPYYVGDTSRQGADNRPLGGAGYVVSDPLVTHQWIVVVLKEGYQTGRAIIEVQKDRTVQVTVFLRFQERIEPFTLLSTRDTTNNTRRTLQFVRSIPVAAGNRQQINNVLATAPGFVRNSLNQVHPRGQRFGVATYLDGFLLPSLPTGQLQGFLPQDVIAQYDIRTGGLSAEYGGDGSVAVDLTTRRPGAAPILEGMLTTGDYNTNEIYVTVGQRFPLRGRGASASAAREQSDINQAQAPVTVVGGASPAPGSQPILTPSFGYLLHVSQRSTNVVTEAPQERQALNNSGRNSSVFGKFDYTLGPLTQIIGLIDINGSQSNIANRNREGGIGFTGRIETSPGIFPPQTLTNTPSQSDERQDQYQKENNSLAMVQIRRVIRPRDIASNPDSSITLTVGGMDNETRLENENRNTDPRDLTNPDSPLFRRNSSLEYNPDVRREYSQFQSQVDLVFSRRNHVIKGGALVNTYTLGERYRLEPGSQVALNALFARSPLLVPTGIVVNPQGLRDDFGNLIVNYAPGRPATANFGQIRREGTYTGLYLQDNWAFNPVLTINGGVRVDTFQLARVGGNARLGLPGNGGSDATEFSPRLNLALQLPRRGFLGFLGGNATRRAVLRVGYNRLFQRPPLGQGTYFGNSAIRPQTGDSYEAGLEKQLGENQVVKATLYSIQFQNYLDVEGLIPGTQFATGALTLVNYPRAISNGFELSYNYNPTFRNNNRVTLFASYTNGSVKLQQRGNSRDSLGRIVTKERPDFDQLHTLNFGFTYRLPANYTVGISSYIGSGLYGSRRPGSDDREGIAEVNLRLSSSPRFFSQSFGLDISVENLLDQQNQYNSYNAYEANRVQSGRRLLTSVYTRF
ncbi:MAG: TonB-dependent receptor [Akkermansiaceae bacterium]|nr:TonB-dependent receptor [Armatimonadota bacterium]